MTSRRVGYRPGPAASSGGGSSSSSSARNWWDPPPVADPTDREFDGDTVPSGIKVFEHGGGEITTYDTVPAHADISFDVPIVSASGVKLQVAHPHKPSNLVVQCAAGKNTYVVERLTLAALQTFRMRWSAARLLAPTQPEVYVGIWKDTGTGPDFTGDYMRVGINGANLWVVTGTTGFPGNLTINTPFDAYRPSEVAFVSHAGNGLNALIRNDQIVLPLGSHNTASLYTAGNTVWVGLFVVPGGSQVIASLDYRRRQADRDIF